MQCVARGAPWAVWLVALSRDAEAVFSDGGQGHEAAIRGMVWTHNERYMLSVDDGGRVKYWRTNYELLKNEAAHQDAVCGVTMAPSDAKFATCSKDGTLKVLIVP